MKTLLRGLLFALFALSSGIAFAQDLPPMTEPGKEHQWLKQFLGDWETDAEGSAGAGHEAMKCQGTVRSEFLGGLWLVSKSKIEASGISIEAIQTIGYDPNKKRYIGTWVDSMMNHLWQYEGSVDETGKILTLEAEGPNFMAAGKSTKFRDIYEFKSPDHIVATSQMQGEDGKWITFMSGNSRRKK
jgi:Protein of unknown function (DUF1579)